VALPPAATSAEGQFAGNSLVVNLGLISSKQTSLE